MDIIVVSSDHAGFRLKEYIKKYLEKMNYIVIDLGTDSDLSVDYPDFIIPAAEYVADNKANYGIVFGGSGNGEAIAANKVKGIRCALCWSMKIGKLAKEHNNANMISLGERVTNKRKAKKIVRIWLESTFLEERHLRRINKIKEYEERLR